MYLILQSSLYGAILTKNCCDGLHTDCSWQTYSWDLNLIKDNNLVLIFLSCHFDRYPWLHKDFRVTNLWFSFGVCLIFLSCHFGRYPWLHKDFRVTNLWFFFGVYHIFNSEWEIIGKLNLFEAWKFISNHRWMTKMTWQNIKDQIVIWN